MEFDAAVCEKTRRLPLRELLLQAAENPANTCSHQEDSMILERLSQMSPAQREKFERDLIAALEISLQK